MTKLADLDRAAKLADRRAILCGQISACNGPAAMVSVEVDHMYRATILPMADGRDADLRRRLLAVMRDDAKARLADVDDELTALGVTL
jgi:hypothetical protein